MADRPRTSDNRKTITHVIEGYSMKIQDLDDDESGDDDSLSLCRNGGGLIRVKGQKIPMVAEGYEYDDDIDR